MLTTVDDGPAIVACNTCRYSQQNREDAEGRRGGALLIAALHAVKESDARYAAIAVQEMSCLFACSAFCAIHVRAPRKLSYVLGRFTPDKGAATSILDYALLHAESQHGRVPLQLWPQAVKGHFISRIPPAGFVIL